MNLPKITPQEKAKQLFDKYIYYVEAISESEQIGNAKECASIFVHEMFYESFNFNTGAYSLERMRYWKEVLKEVEKIC